MNLVIDVVDVNEMFAAGSVVRRTKGE